MGVRKSKERLELEKYDIIELLNGFTMKEIADRFNCSTTLVNTVARKAYATKEINKFEESKEEIEFLGTKGAWAELKSTQLYKQIMNERNK